MLNLHRAQRLADKLGAGLITGAADDDPSGLVTYSQARAQFGAGLLWTMAFTTPLMANGIDDDPAAKARAQRAVLDDGGGRARHHHQPLPLLLAGCAGGRTAPSPGCPQWQRCRSRRPLAGDFAFTLFALGVIGTGMLAVPVLAASSAYAVADAFQWRSGLDLRLVEARGFFSVLASGRADPDDAPALDGLARNCCDGAGGGCDDRHGMTAFATCCLAAVCHNCVAFGSRECAPEASSSGG